MAGYPLFAASNSPPPLARVAVSPPGGAYGESRLAGTRGYVSPLAHYRDKRGIVCAPPTVPLHAAVVYDRWRLDRIVRSGYRFCCTSYCGDRGRIGSALPTISSASINMAHGTEG